MDMPTSSDRGAPCAGPESRFDPFLGWMYYEANKPGI